MSVFYNKLGELMVVKEIVKNQLGIVTTPGAESILNLDKSENVCFEVLIKISCFLVYNIENIAEPAYGK